MKSDALPVLSLFFSLVVFTCSLFLSAWLFLFLPTSLFSLFQLVCVSSVFVSCFYFFENFSCLPFLVYLTRTCTCVHVYMFVTTHNKEIVEKFHRKWLTSGIINPVKISTNSLIENNRAKYFNAALCLSAPSFRIEPNFFR